MTQTFENCSLYVKGEFLGNVIRIEAKTATVTTGVKYAQYDDAIKVTWRGPRQRRERGFYITYRPFLVVLRQHEAFEPASMTVPTDTSVAGMRTSEGRYAAFDPRWMTDFHALLQSKGVTPLFAHITPEEVIA